MSNKNVRIRTTPGGEDKYLKVKLEQDVDNLEILSLRISQAEAYKRVCSDYGVIVGRAIANGGVGVPNAKISVFIPLSDDDAENELIRAIYPFTTVTEGLGVDNKRYNLLPDHNTKNDKCYTPTGSFPSKRKLLDNDILLEIHEKYYKFTTTTNNSGDYMLFGVPVGSHTLHMDVDMSDIGVLSQKPYDLIREGSNIKIFESTTKFKGGDDLNTLAQIKTINTGINVVPFWGDIEECEIGINRFDFEIPTRIESHAFFMGSLFSDSEKNSVSQSCRIKKKLGNLCDTVTGEGTIEMIRKTPDGLNEVYTVEGGRVIDEDGTWAYQIPMNLDYKVTDEFGQLVPSTVPNTGIATKSDVRFRISMDMTGGEGRYRRRAKYLVPNNPTTGQGDYTFDSNTPTSEFRTITWNNIYTVTNFISRFQAVKAGSIRDFVGIKDVDDCGSHTPFPYNRYDTDINVLYSVLCVIMNIIIIIVNLINLSIIRIVNGLIKIVNLIPFTEDTNYIACVDLECGGQKYVPGCGTDTKGYEAAGNDGNNNKDDALDCYQTQLAESLNVFEFDFYNDWINGTLYLPQFKYKKKKNGTEKYCNADDTSNKNNHIIDTCLNNSAGLKKVETASINIGNDGLVKKVDDIFYYASAPKDNPGMKLMSTDIVSLGPINECNKISNGYFMINQVPETTYNRPPTGDEKDGSDTISTGIDGLLMNISCLRVTTNKTYCTNTKRICEIGMGLDEPFGSLSSSDGRLDNNDLTSEDVRARFISNNSSNPYDATNTLGTPYNTFRDIETLGNNVKLSDGKSFYFYFGINPGKSAIQKFNSKYRVECTEEVETTFLINVINVTPNTTPSGTDGAVDIEIVGGSGNYQYEWYDSSNNTIGTSQDITTLASGNYKVEVIDLNTGKISTREVEILGPSPLGLDISIVPETTFNASDGQLIVNILGGNEPFDLTITGPTTLSQTGINAPFPGHTFTGLPDGTYTVTVTDSNSSTESETAIITGPPDLTLTVTKENTKCGEDNGVINLTVVDGTAPYDIEVKDSTSAVVGTGFLNNGLEAGSYDIEVTDNAGVIKSSSITINSSSEITITSQTATNAGAPLNGVIEVGATGGVTYLEYNLFDISGTKLTSNSTGYFSGLTSTDTYKVEVEDSVKCIVTSSDLTIP